MIFGFCFYTSVLAAAEMKSRTCIPWNDIVLKSCCLAARNGILVGVCQFQGKSARTYRNFCATFMIAFAMGSGRIFTPRVWFVSWSRRSGWTGAHSLLLRYRFVRFAMVVSARITVPFSLFVYSTIMLRP